jgi:hypothetical protein
MYNVQQSIQEAMSFGFEARIRYNGMIAGYEREGDVAIGSLGSLNERAVSRLKSVHTYSGVHDALCLNEHHLLQELDAAYAHAGGGLVHAPQDAGLDGRHDLPILGIVGVRDTGSQSSMRESSIWLQSSGGVGARVRAMHVALIMEGSLI